MMQADVARPRVLLVDDDAGVRKAVSRTLATDFEVVATVTDGRKALNAVALFDPDVVVLDISMPGLNGFQTAEELKRLGSPAKIVFLTMHQDDDFVSKAIRSGAMGYVLKMLAWSDLTPALHHALAGRRYLPSLTPLVMTGVDTHAVQFCRDDSSGLDGAANVLSSALDRGDIVATVLIESNRDALALRMKARGWNLADAGKQGRYVAFDAEEAANRIMRAGRPHADSIAEMIDALESMRTASVAGPRSHLTIVGEISAVLCRRGIPEAAVELERLWDELTRSLPILTICAYPTGCWNHDGASELVSGISAHHSVISHAVRAGRS
jgi:CheY-like chemotaxis protein